MDNILVATIKSWNMENVNRLRLKYKDYNIFIVDDSKQLGEELLQEIAPKYVFFPHWSWIIPQSIYEKYECIVFHMTDLPYGRGGSPLQNLLVRGVYKTKISAIRVDAGLDTGDVYLKKGIDISEGNADDILKRVSDIIFNEMIPEIIEKQPIPQKQNGEIVEFKRRNPNQSKMPEGLSQRQIYDYIRMLDGEDYPPAFSMLGGKKIIYRNAYMKDGITYADAVFGD